MNNKVILLTLAGLGMGAAAYAADSAFTVTNLDLRATVIDGGAIYSSGSIIADPSFTYNEGNNSSQDINIELVWTGLNFDDVGAADDTISFVFNIATDSANNINFNNQGLRPNPWVAGDMMTLSFVSATTNNAGFSATFDGFTGAGFGASGNASTLNGAQLVGDINGEAVTITMDGTGAYQYKASAVTFAAQNSIVWDLTSLDADMSAWTRNESFGFSVTAVPEPGAYALFAGALALGAVMIRRRR